VAAGALLLLPLVLFGLPGSSKPKDVQLSKVNNGLSLLPIWDSTCRGLRVHAAPQRTCSPRPFAQHSGKKHAVTFCCRAQQPKKPYASALQVEIPWSSNLPAAPEECPFSLRSKVAWGVGTSAYQVLHRACSDVIVTGMTRSSSLHSTMQLADSSNHMVGNKGHCSCLPSKELSDLHRLHMSTTFCWPAC
jgi:hypothetical protein